MSTREAGPGGGLPRAPGRLRGLQPPPTGEPKRADGIAAPLNTVSGETDATRPAQRRTRSVALFDRRMLRRRHRERRPCSERAGVRVFDARTPRRAGSREASQVRQCGLRHEKTRQADATRVRSGLHPKAASETAKSPRTRHFGRRPTGACYASVLRLLCVCYSSVIACVILRAAGAANLEQAIVRHENYSGRPVGGTCSFAAYQAKTGVTGGVAGAPTRRLRRNFCNPRLRTGLMARASSPPAYLSARRRSRARARRRSWGG